MSIIDWFSKKSKQTVTRKKLNIPGNLWVKCFTCNETRFLKDLQESDMVCPCGYHFRLTVQKRIKYMFDKNSFNEIHQSLSSVDFLKFVDKESYATKIKKYQVKTGQTDAVLIGTASINALPINVGIMDFSFMGGSMGSVVGEKITRLIELGIANKHSVVIFSSSGGARMQEGLLSLMQMAKTSAALYQLRQAKVPFISVLTDPTTGGTSASFSMLGDVNIAEPGALISFAGPRVIEQTIRQKLPKGFQTSEFLLDHGMVDMVIERKELPQTLYRILSILNPPHPKETLKS